MSGLENIHSQIDSVDMRNDGIIDSDADKVIKSQARKYIEISGLEGDQLNELVQSIKDLLERQDVDRLNLIDKYEQAKKTIIGEKLGDKDIGYLAEVADIRRELLMISLDINQYLRGYFTFIDQNIKLPEDSHMSPKELQILIQNLKRVIILKFKEVYKLLDEVKNEISNRNESRSKDERELKLSDYRIFINGEIDNIFGDVREVLLPGALHYIESSGEELSHMHPLRRHVIDTFKDSFIADEKYFIFGEEEFVTIDSGDTDGSLIDTSQIEWLEAINNNLGGSPEDTGRGDYGYSDAVGVNRLKRYKDTIDNGNLTELSCLNEKDREVDKKIQMATVGLCLVSIIPVAGELLDAYNVHADGGEFIALLKEAGIAPEEYEQLGSSIDTVMQIVSIISLILTAGTLGRAIKSAKVTAKLAQFGLNMSDAVEGIRMVVRGLGVKAKDIAKYLGDFMPDMFPEYLRVEGRNIDSSNIDSSNSIGNVNDTGVDDLPKGIGVVSGKVDGIGEGLTQSHLLNRLQGQGEWNIFGNLFQYYNTPDNERRVYDTMAKIKNDKGFYDSLTDHIDSLDTGGDSIALRYMDTAGIGNGNGEKIGDSYDFSLSDLDKSVPQDIISKLRPFGVDGVREISFRDIQTIMLKTGDNVVVRSVDGNLYTYQIEKFLGAGNTSHVLDIGDNRVIRFPFYVSNMRGKGNSPSFFNEQYFKEREKYVGIAGLNIPKILDRGLNYEYLVVEKVPSHKSADELIDRFTEIGQKINNGDSISLEEKAEFDRIEPLLEKMEELAIQIVEASGNSGRIDAIKREENVKAIVSEMRQVAVTEDGHFYLMDWE